VTDSDPGLLVKPTVACRQLDAEEEAAAHRRAGEAGVGQPDVGTEAVVTTGTAPSSSHAPEDEVSPGVAAPKRFYGVVQLNPARVGRDAGQIAEEIIAHLSGLVGADVTVTLEVEARMPDGAPEQVVRTVTENAATLKFSSQGFEME